MRNFGVTSGAAPGDEPRPRSLRADTPRDPDDRELSALAFVALCSSPLFVGSAVLFYIAWNS